MPHGKLVAMGEWRSEDVASTGILHAVVAVDQGAAWAFGISSQRTTQQFATLVLHRDRRGWERVEVPQIGRVNRAIAVHDADVWAVGDGCSLHWDGRAWQKVPTAVVSGSEPQFFGLAQFGSADVWTAGYAHQRTSRQARGTVQHWDGHAWTDLPMPAVADFWSLKGIGGVSPADLWAVGSIHGPQGEGLALHWDGRKWQRRPAPRVEGRSVKLSDIAVLDHGDTWAGGYSQVNGRSATRRPVTVHWDGQAWSPGDIPDSPGQITELVSDGRQLRGLGYAPSGVAYVAVLDGTSWQVTPGPAGPPGASRTLLHSGAVLSDGNLLAVGSSSMPDNSSRPFAAILAG